MAPAARSVNHPDRHRCPSSFPQPFPDGCSRPAHTRSSPCRDPCTARCRASDPDNFPHILDLEPCHRLLIHGFFRCGSDWQRHLKWARNWSQPPDGSWPHPNRDRQNHLPHRRPRLGQTPSGDCLGSGNGVPPPIPPRPVAPKPVRFAYGGVQPHPTKTAQPPHIAQPSDVLDANICPASSHANDDRDPRICKRHQLL